MIVKSTTALHNDYGISSDEQREEILKLRAKLEAVEEDRLSGAPVPIRWRNPENSWRRSISADDLATPV